MEASSINPPKPAKGAFWKSLIAGALSVALCVASASCRIAGDDGPADAEAGAAGQAPAPAVREVRAAIYLQVESGSEHLDDLAIVELNELESAVDEWLAANGLDTGAMLAVQGKPEEVEMGDGSKAKVVSLQVAGDGAALLCQRQNGKWMVVRHGERNDGAEAGPAPDAPAGRGEDEEDERVFRQNQRANGTSVETHFDEGRATILADRAVLSESIDPQIAESLEVDLFGFLRNEGFEPLGAADAYVSNDGISRNGPVVEFVAMARVAGGQLVVRCMYDLDALECGFEKLP